MATEQIMATWERDANERAAAALATLTERFDLDIPAEQPERLDARMKQIRVLQRHTVILEALAEATANVEKTGTVESGEPTLEAMKRTDLNALALERGLENPESFPNKAALIAAIEAAGDQKPSSEDSPVDEPDDETDSGDTDVNTDETDNEQGGES